MSSPALMPGPQPRPVISAEEVRVDLGGRTILADVSFAIEDGELVAILGPNGAGKSTLLKVILGLVKPVSGRVSVLGQPAGPGKRAHRLRSPVSRHRGGDDAEGAGRRALRPGRKPLGAGLAQPRPGKAHRRGAGRGGRPGAGQGRHGGAFRRRAAAASHRPGPAERSPAPAAGRAAGQPGPGQGAGDHRAHQARLPVARRRGAVRDPRREPPAVRRGQGALPCQRQERHRPARPGDHPRDA